MNIAITDGLLLMPPAFDQGLTVWSREDGTPGSATYAGGSDAAIVQGDADFGTCLEIIKTQTTQKLRFMAETPVLPGTYLRITARVKAVSGNLPSVRIGAWAGRANGSHLAGVVEVGPTNTIPAYGRVVEVSAIVGSGARSGVDMAWGRDAVFGHFGLDLIGATGGVIRIESIRIEDVTTAFARSLMDWVDVRDFGAKGDGLTDDRAAFLAADAAAGGREILVSAGRFYLGGHISIAAPVRFQGTVVMPTAARLTLLSNYDFPTYAEAFGDEHLGLAKALQVLFTASDHNTLDLRGRRIDLREPLDMGALLPDVASFSNRRVISNGLLNVVDGPAWDTRVVTSQATYSTAQSIILTDVANIANIPVGARITGTGVGREVYVKAVNVAAQSLTLSQPFFGGSGTRVLTFTRYRYALDFSAMAKLDRLVIDNVELLLNGIASGVMLAPEGEVFQMRDSWVNRPRDRGITSIGRACQGMMIDNCQFLSNEMGTRAQERTSIAINVNANDTKIRDSRFVRFAHVLVADGSGHLIVGNHWFQGDGEPNGLRLAGIVFTQPNIQSSITGNYIDNNHIEWTNERSPEPDWNQQYSFGGLTITGNTFVCTGVAPWFKWLAIKPYGRGHYVHGLTVQSNVFKALNCTVDRIEAVDTTYADLDYGRMRNILIEGNMFNAISQPVANPLTTEVVQATAGSSWVVRPTALPFEGWLRKVEGLAAEGAITNAAGQRVTEMPYVQVEQGSDRREARVNFAQPAKGKLVMRVRMDQPN
ncbi:right-handed parallel beta-helix repeat-containing protein [Paracoccus sp. p4-l81]|uniref:right-handed parallel beta-helix repeat-containing protein n=1 Tax=Paracoccus sp. p4-l81 TaxID=3342806 RepID=UPI0035B7F8ED